MNQKTLENKNKKLTEKKFFAKSTKLQIILQIKRIKIFGDVSRNDIVTMDFVTKMVHRNLSKEDKWSLKSSGVRCLHCLQKIKRIRRIISIMVTGILWKNIKNSYSNRRLSLSAKKINLRKRTQNITTKAIEAEVAHNTCTSTCW